MLKKLILRNAKRQLGDYVLYCITIACAVACMYAYNALLFSDKVRQLPELEVLPYMIIAVTLLIILVMGWLVSYMTGYMLKRRSRELSLYMVSGLSARTIAGLFLYENLIIAGTAFIAGLPAGILLSWLVESAVLKMFGMTFTLGFSVSFKTAGLTLLYFAAMYLSALHKSKKRIYKIRLYDLLYYDRQTESSHPCRKPFFTGIFLLSLLLFTAGYALIVIRPIGRGFDLLTGLVFLVIGLFAFFFSVPSFLSERLEKRKGWTYRKNRLTVFRGFTSKIRSMSVVLGTLSVLFTLSITFLGIASAAGHFADQSIGLNVFDILIPHEGEMTDFSSYEERISERFPVKSAHVYGIYTGRSREFYTVWENEVEERKKVRMTPRAEFQYDNYMKQSDYLYLRHMLGYEEPELDKNSCYVHCIPQLADEFEDYMEKSGKLEINGQSLMMGKIFSESFSQNDTYGNGLDYILVIPDETAEGMELLYSLYAVITEVPLNGMELRQLTEGERLVLLDRGVGKSVETENGNAVTSLVYTDKDYLSGKWVQKDSLSQIYVILICLVYLSVILEIAGTAVLATQALSDGDKKKRQNRILGQLGMNEKMINRLNNRQLLLLFLLPVPPALIISGWLIYDGARRIVFDAPGMPVFSGEFWIWQAMGTALGFFVLVYGIYYTAVRIGGWE